MEITKQTWKDVVGLRQRGVQVRKGETSVVDEFNKMQCGKPSCRGNVASYGGDQDHHA